MLQWLFDFMNFYITNENFGIHRSASEVQHKDESACSYPASVWAAGCLRLHQQAKSIKGDDERIGIYHCAHWTSTLGRMIPASLQWIILISEIFLPYLHLLAIVGFLVLTGISISTSFITLPLLFHGDGRNCNGLQSTNLANLRNLITRVSDVTVPIERALLVSLLLLSFFSLRYSDAVVHWRFPYHFASLAVFTSMLAFDARSLSPVEERISVMDPETMEIERLGKSLEAAKLMREWRSLRLRRMMFPLFAGLVSLYSFAQKRSR